MTRREIKAEIEALKRHRRIMTVTNRLLAAGRDEPLKQFWSGDQIRRLKEPPVGFQREELVRIADKIRRLKLRLIDRSAK